MKPVGINIKMSPEENEVVEERARCFKTSKQQALHDFVRKAMLIDGLVKQNASDKARGLV